MSKSSQLVLLLFGPFLCSGAIRPQNDSHILGEIKDSYNVIEFLLDDVGMELLKVYDDQNAWPAGFPYPATPNIDRIVQSGVTFRNFWAHPVCSPDRAAALTGRYGIISPSHPYGTGIGTGVDLDEPKPFTSAMMALPLAHAAEGSDYIHLQTGKWHLGNGQDDPMNPVVAGGVTEYRGCLTNPNEHDSNLTPPYGGDYANYTQTVARSQGSTQVQGQSLWMGTQEVNDSLAMLPDDSTPFVLRHWFHYSHSPWRDPVPDAELDARATMRGTEQYPYAQTVLTYRPANNAFDPDDDTNTYHYVHRRVKAGLEAADKAIGDVLAGLSPAQRKNTIVIIRSDNGTEQDNLDPSPPNALPTSPPEPPPSYNPAHGKGSVYQQGINVPLIIGAALGNSEPRWIAPTLRGKKVDAICSTVDIWATVAEATLPSWETYKTDGESLLRVLTGEKDQVRGFVYSFRFGPNGSCWSDALLGFAAVRDQAGFKLIRKLNNEEEFFSLASDPLETNNLLPLQSPHNQASYNALRERLDFLLSPKFPAGFCYGDGKGSDCPCNNFNDGSRFCGKAGCANSDSSAGAALISLGVPSLSRDDVVLRAFGCPPNTMGVFLQYDSVPNGGLGVPFADGLSCVGGAAFRIEMVPSNAQGDVLSSTGLGEVGSALPGDLKRYQLWYRDVPHGQCSSNVNWSNGIALDWVP